MLLHAIEVVDVFWRLRAHQTKTVALLSQQNEVMGRLLSIQDSDEAARINGNYVAVKEVIRYCEGVYDWCSDTP
jgi:hypothetical protein